MKGQSMNITTPFYVIHTQNMNITTPSCVTLRLINFKNT